MDDGASDGTVEFLDRCPVAGVTSGLSEGDSALAEQDRVVGLRDKEVEGNECEKGPNREDPVGPAPGDILVHEAAY